jgi:hypothetical protein
VVLLILWGVRRRSSTMVASPGPDHKIAAESSRTHQELQAIPSVPATEKVSTSGLLNSRAENPAPANANPPVPKTVTHPVAAKPPATFTVMVRAEKTTLVSILADGRPVVQETLIAPAHTSVRAGHEVVVKVGDAAGISFLLNGKSVSAPASDGEAKTYIFDASGLVTNQAQPPATNQ